MKERAIIRGRIEADDGVQAKEAACREAVENWWAEHRRRIEGLPESGDLMAARADLLTSFTDALGPVGLLDRFAVSGAVVSWWDTVQFDLKTLVARGFQGVVEGWVTTITTAIQEDGKKDNPLEHKLVRRLLPEFLEEIASAEAQVAELDGTVKAAQSSGDEEDDGEEDENALSEAELKALKKKLTAAKKKLKGLKESFVQRLEEAREGLSVDESRELVLDALRGDLDAEVERRGAADLQAIVGVVETWWEKYRVTLREIENERDAAKGKLDGFLEELGYVG